VLLATAQPIVNVFHIRLFLATGIGLVVIMLARTEGLIGFVTRTVREVEASFKALPESPPAPETPPPTVRVRGRQLAPGTSVSLRLRSRPKAVRS
jgi:hypothetical protein